jgi:hypothetical protein
MNPLNARQDYGLSSFDIPHVASINATYEIPFRSKGSSGAGAFARKVLGDWQASVITTVQSGLPFSPQLGFNPTNEGNSRNPGRPSLNPAFTGNIITGNPNQYYNPIHRSFERNLRRCRTGHFGRTLSSRCGLFCIEANSDP